MGCQVVQQPWIWGFMCNLSRLIAPLSCAVFVGILVGWVWKPKQARQVIRLIESSAIRGKSSNHLNKLSDSSASFQTKVLSPTFVSRLLSDDNLASGSSSGNRLIEREEDNSILSYKDLEELYKLYEEKDGGSRWIQLMNRSTATMSYEAWRRDRHKGPPEYRMKTVFEDCDPELARDFFWDDEFRSKWDDMLIDCETLEECPSKGSFIVKWVRKFPFFCSDREYIIGRRIWESEKSYWCVTRSVPNDVARRDKPRRVDLYYSSWSIRAVESKRGMSSACEVVLFHYEDMGIPWEIAKLGVRQGMWGAVKKIEPGLRAYQTLRASGAPLSRSAAFARLTTKCPALTSKLTDSDTDSPPPLSSPPSNHFPKLLLVAGALAFLSSIHRGHFAKPLLLGVARRFATVPKHL